jgi:hypothetical protein
VASIASYLLTLAQNPAEKAVFDKDTPSAKASMTAAGLSPDQQAVLLTNDPDQIRAAVNAELGDTPPHPDLQPLMSNWICGRPPEP